LFYQLEGSITIIIKKMENAMFRTSCRWYVFAPCKSTPFPITFRGFNRLGYWTKRAGQGYTDGLLWYCESCNHKLHEVYFELNDIEKTLFLILNTFTSHWRWELVKMWNSYGNRSTICR
jgi:3-hydroxyanthranilate 3,4-dioxygenase